MEDSRDSRRCSVTVAATLVGQLAVAALVGQLAVVAPLAAQMVGPAGAAPLSWAECQPGQIEVMILGTFHFAQASDFDVLEPRRQAELDDVLGRLAAFDPDRVSVEFPRDRADELQGRYEAVRGGAAEIESPNEIFQLGFRLADRLGHDEIYAVDVPINLWHDSIQVFDDAYPTSRTALRTRWSVRHASDSGDRETQTLREILIAENRDAIPANNEMYAGFLPLVEDGVYAGALKLRPWYDRNLRTIQNMFRAGEPDDRRWLLIIGSGHLRVLKQMMEMTPQLCPVDAVGYLDR